MGVTFRTEAGPRRCNKFTVAQKKVKKASVYARKNCKYKTKAGLVAVKKLSSQYFHWIISDQTNKTNI